MVVHGACEALWALVAVRIALGALFAVIDTAGCPLVAETVPARVRGITLSALMFTFILGVFCNGVVCWLMWRGVSDADWRVAFYVAGGVGIAFSVVAAVALRESPRFLLTQQRYIVGFLELDVMGYTNHGKAYEAITEQEVGEHI